LLSRKTFMNRFRREIQHLLPVLLLLALSATVWGQQDSASGQDQTGQDQTGQDQTGAPPAATGPAGFWWEELPDSRIAVQRGHRLECEREHWRRSCGCGEPGTRLTGYAKALEKIFGSARLCGRRRFLFWSTDRIAKPCLPGAYLRG
jgi:hypothetical protein